VGASCLVIQIKIVQIMSTRPKPVLNHCELNAKVMQVAAFDTTLVNVTSITELVESLRVFFNLHDSLKGNDNIMLLCFLPKSIF
jgi:hypothetical protein